MLLAVDLGLRTGLACFTTGGALLWFRAQNLGTVTRLKRAIPRVLDEAPELSLLVVEGDRHLGDLWARAAIKRGARVRRTNAEEWREATLLPRERRSGADAKAAAIRVAGELIEGFVAQGLLKRPRTALLDDVAEAICIGAWAARLPVTGV